MIIVKTHHMFLLVLTVHVATVSAINLNNEPQVMEIAVLGREGAGKSKKKSLEKRIILHYFKLLCSCSNLFSLSNLTGLARS